MSKSKFTKDFERLARIKDVRMEDGFPDKPKGSREIMDQAWKKIRSWETNEKPQEESGTLRTMKSLAGIEFRPMWTEADAPKKKKPTMANREYVSGHGNKSVANTGKGDGTGSGEEYEEPDPDDEFETDDDEDLDWDPDEDDEECDPDDEDCEDEDDEEEEEDEEVEESKKKPCGAAAKDCGCGCTQELGERQKEDPALALPGEEPTRKGAFKLSSKSLNMFKKEIPELDNPSRILFKTQQRVLNDIPRDDLPKLFGKTNMSDAQDFLARRPRKAFQMFMMKSKQVSPKLHRMLTAVPTNASLYFYGIMLRVSGKDMADIILKRFFATESDHPDAPMEDAEGMEEGLPSSISGKFYKGGGSSPDWVYPLSRNKNGSYKVLSSDFLWKKGKPMEKSVPGKELGQFYKVDPNPPDEIVQMVKAHPKYVASFEEHAILEAAAKGKAQEIIMDYLKRSKAGVSAELADIARDPGMHGVHFKSVMSAAEALAKKHLVSLKGSTIALGGKMESVTDSMTALLERRMRGGKRPIARRMSKARRW